MPSVALVAASFAEDFFSFGAGAVYDAISTAFASMMIERGLAMMRGKDHALPKATSPTSVRVRTKVSLSGM